MQYWFNGKLYDPNHMDTFTLHLLEDNKQLREENQRLKECVRCNLIDCSKCSNKELFKTVINDNKI